MNHRGPIARSFAFMLAVVLSIVCVPVTSAQDGATLAGTLLGADGERPLDGAILHVGDKRTGEVYSSELTGDDGAFEIKGLPAAAYDLAVEQDGGLFVVGSAVQLAGGQERQVQIAINAQAAPAPGAAKVGGGFWDKPVWATLAVVGGAFLIGALVSAADDTNEGIASPFLN